MGMWAGSPNIGTCAKPDKMESRGRQQQDSHRAIEDAAYRRPRRTDWQDDADATIGAK